MLFLNFVGRSDVLYTCRVRSAFVTENRQTDDVVCEDIAEATQKCNGLYDATMI